MKEIQLGQQGKNKGKYVALVDDEDFEKVNNLRWYVAKHKHTYYAVRSEINKNGIQYNIMLHQFIIGGKMIDHIDHNGLNCQKYNLRPCTHSQNMMNKRSCKNSSSIYKGVSKHSHANKWVSMIRFNGKYNYLGYYFDEIEAAKAYDKKAIEVFGDFANTNFK